MRRKWDQRARRNAFLYIASWRKDWDEASFFESGEQDYVRLVHPILQKLQFDPAAKSMAELGCGAGRMTRSFAQRFRSVLALDISEEMQSRAKTYLQSFENIRWLLSDGQTLSGVQSNSVDFVFSYLVLQHMPEKQVVCNAIREMMRILHPSGAFLFQFNGSDRPTMNWRGRAVSGFLDCMSSVGLHRMSQCTAQLFGIDPEMLGKTWRGASLSVAEVEQAVLAGRGCPAGFLEPRTPLAWCYGRKQVEA
jgi:ubiquinone/menaquinone biosynthesis C-methylase UbiE